MMLEINNHSAWYAEYKKECKELGKKPYSEEYCKKSYFGIFAKIAASWAA